jgi:hypothetical protein
MTELAGDYRRKVDLSKAMAATVEVALPAGALVLVGFVILITATGGETSIDLPAVTGWLTLSCASACLATWVVTNFANRGKLNRPARIVSLALLTRLLGVLLMPVVLALWSAPGALNGGEMPCFHIDSSCASGLHGMDAIGGLIDAALSWYPVGIFLILPGILDMVLIIPAAIWDKLTFSRVTQGAYLPPS